MMKIFSTLARDTKGAITVELALAAPILAAMLIGLIDISTLYSDKLRLEQIAQRMIEKVQQKASFATTDEATLEAEAVAAAGTGATAEVTYWLECNGVKQTGSSAYTGTCPNGQTLARYMQIDIYKSYSTIIVARFAGSSTSGAYTLHGKAGLRTL